MIQLVRSGEFTLLQFNGPCDVSECGALCCRMRRYYSVALEDDELQKYPHQKNGQGQNVLIGQENGDCVYLRENKCLIYEHRPKGCREWHCSPGGGLTDPEITKRNNGWVLFPSQEAK